MDEQNLDKISAALRNIRKGEVDRPVSKKDISLQKRELPPEEIDEKVAREKKQRQKEIADIKKGEDETQLKKKIAEESIKKFREGGITDRKQRIEELKAAEKDFFKTEEEGDSFDDLLTESQRQSKDEESTETDDVVASDDIEQTEEESVSPTQDVPSFEQTDGDEVTPQSLEPVDDVSDDASQQTDEVDIPETSQTDVAPQDDVISQDDETPQDEDYTLDSGQEALPSLEEMDIDQDKDFWSNAEDEEISQDEDKVDEVEPIAEEVQLDETPQDQEPLSQTDDVDTFIDTTEQNLEQESSKQNLDQPPEEISETVSKDEQPTQPEGPVEINTDVAVPVIDDLDSFDKVEAQKAMDRLKKTFLGPLLRSFRYKKATDDILEDEEDNDWQDISSDEEKGDAVAAVEEGKDLGEKAPLSEKKNEEQAESFWLDDDFESAETNKEGLVRDQDDEEKDISQPPEQRATVAKQEEVDEPSLDDKNEDIFPEEETTGEIVEEEAQEQKTSPPSFAAAASKPKEIDQKGVDRLLSETEVDEVSFDDIAKNVDYSSPKVALDETVSDDNYQKALAIINSYDSKNRNLIVEALTSNRLSDEDADRISAMVLNGEDEQNVVAFVQNQIYQKTYRENLKEDLADRTEEEELVQRYQKRRRVLGFARLIAATIFIAATAFFFVFYGVDMVRSEIAYRDSYANIEDRRYDLGEKRFEDAYKIMPSVRWINRIADLYIDRGLFLDAEKKYLRGLDFDPQNEDLLNEYAQMLTFRGDYSRAYRKFQEALKYHPGNIESQRGLAENFIEWGIENERRWVEGDKVLSELASHDDNNKLFYLSKKLEIASLRKNYPTSKFYYELFKEENEKYVDEKSLRRYSQFLIDHYRRINTAIGQGGIDQNLQRQNNYIVATIQEIIEKVFGKNPNYLPAIYTTASWFHVLDQDDKALKWVRRGIEIIEKKNQPVLYRERFSPTHFYNLEGQLFYEKRDFYSALVSFQNSIDLNPNDAFANYYLGRIDLTEINDLAKAEERLGLAYINWNMEKDDTYRDLLYTYGYVNYKQGRSQLDQEKLERALSFWNQLLNDQQITHSIPVEFALSLTYLGLERYDLAQAFIDDSIEDIAPDLDYFQKNRGEVPDRVLERIKMLSDNYNNLGVVQASKALSERQRNRYINKQKAIEHFIDSITLKDELNLLKGVPYANFNRINKFPQVSEEFFLSDSSLPKTLLP